MSASWMEDGRCAGMNPDPWFSDDARSVAYAKSVCVSFGSEQPFDTMGGPGAAQTVPAHSPNLDERSELMNDATSDPTARPDRAVNCTCSADGCSKAPQARGMCNTHYARWWRAGGKDHTNPPGAISERFWSKVDLSNPDGCWPWAGSYRHKYGEVWVDGKKQYAHRVAASLVLGDVPDGMIVRHHCDNPKCVRPDHLELGTQADNMADVSERGRWKNQNGSGPNHPGPLWTERPSGHR